MSNMSKSVLQMNTLEELTRKDTPIHRFQPSAKLIITVIYLIAIISFGPYQISGLIPYILYPIIFMILGEIPFRPLFYRVLIALPFALAVGISSLIFNKNIAIYIFGMGISEGLLSFCSILLKTVLTVLAVLVLISTTSINELMYVMVRFKIPPIIVIQIMMTYHYVRLLLEEVSAMYHSYILRAPKEKGIKLKDMAPFLGQLIIRSFDRAERIYKAMQCKGFEGSFTFSKKEKITKEGWFYITFIGCLFILMRVVNVSKVIGNLLVK
jgi:cobalt/nickel transport system permease protein